MGKNTKGRTFLALIMIVVLVAVLGGLWLLNSRNQNTRSAELKARAEEIASSKSADSERAVSSVPEVAESESVAVEAEEEEEVGITGISVRGDSFNTDGTDEEDGYPALLQALLTENDYDLEVEDNTWDMAGTLSQMALAGVDEDEIQDYIDAHTEEQGGSITAVESVVRDDLDEKQTEREDLNDIPVICMGYYGGWNNDLDELIEQQQKILDTYEQTDAYIICGFYPYSVSDRDAYDEAMEEAWGEHYLPLNDAIGGTAAMTADGRELIAEAIYDKLVDLGYLEE